ncbi:MAG: TolC family protein [Lentimicrobium sp.]|uniref:TolC family protein n=1 Tax=Lentimicrobium sp. TaxID=2034841 RepID=UPI0025EE9F3E|nr:TolC family protein [Lentimicrobium sp.]MCO5256503.1 TolC family protein [Lentimicrobium sp.]MCO5262993.1 TolC family protein [Lentimicrobium sp.]HPF65241.1 TolC family protein [Lentimicrobium sp.]HRW69992.1 TolC family protein [Lentimicrobium sp.]
MKVMQFKFRLLNVLLAGFLFTSFSPAVLSQVLLPADAVNLALENNYAIRIARLDQEILKNNLTPGNAGFLPAADLSAGQNNSITNARQEYLTGQINERDNAKSNSLSAGASLNWTLFDGMRMFNAYALLRQQLNAGELRTRLQIENTIASVLGSYYNIVQLRQRMAVFVKAVTLGEERVEIAREMLLLGSGSRLDLLQAEVDLNTDRSQLLEFQEMITGASITLNQLMARDAALTFSVEDTITIMPVLDYNALESAMLRSNPQLLLSQLDIDMANRTLRDIRGRRAPVIGMNLGYSFNNQNSESGFLKTSRTSGVNYGITANMSIFDGFNLNRQAQNARIGMESAALQQQAYTEQLKAELLSSYKTYSSKLQMVALERQNLETANINFEIAGERFRLGELSGIEYREAQKNLLAANERLISAVYEVRLLEISLMQLSGTILPE